MLKYVLYYKTTKSTCSVKICIMHRHTVLRYDAFMC